MINVVREESKPHKEDNKACFSVATNRYIDIVSIYCVGQHAYIYCLI